jgi:hypothetical protein
MQTPGQDLLRHKIREPVNIVHFRTFAVLKKKEKKTKV